MPPCGQDRFALVIQAHPKPTQTKQSKRYPCGFPWLSKYGRREGDKVSIDAACLFMFPLATVCDSVQQRPCALCPRGARRGTLRRTMHLVVSRRDALRGTAGSNKGSSVHVRNCDAEIENILTRHRHLLDSCHTENFWAQTQSVGGQSSSKSPDNSKARSLSVANGGWNTSHSNKVECTKATLMKTFVGECLSALP